MDNFYDNIDKIMEELKLKGIETVELEDSDTSGNVLSNTTHMDNLLGDIATIDKTLPELLKVSMEGSIATVITEINKIVKNQKSTDKQEVKEAKACFEFLGVNLEEKCPHGLKFFQCMPCSH